MYALPTSANDLIAPEILLSAYAAGIFPMGDSESGELNWYAPDPRAIIPLDNFRTTRSLRQTIQKKKFEVRFDTAFESVMRACAGREETWITEGIVASYVRLFDLGFAHSVESWCNNELAGGLYGVALGGAFFGESMFSVRTDASKVSLCALVDRMNARGFELLDTQFTTPHLEQFGTMEIPRDLYLLRLNHAIEKECIF